ncbi:MAG: choice-of-anchor V domain-containing protein [Crocinitomicaceae bacterium]
MKKSYILGITAIASIAFLSFQKSGVESVEKYLSKNGHKLFTGGAPNGKTGAPTEGSCVDCHIGSTMDGSSVNTLTILNGSAQVVSNYVPGGVYNIALSLNQGDVKEGFQATVLDGSNNMVGTFADVLGTNITNAGSVQYANHTAVTSNEGNNAWVWSWTAPATDVGTVTFYVASNISNGDGATSGDVIYLSQHVLGSAASISEEEAFEAGFTAGYSAMNNSIAVNFNSLAVASMNMNLVDLNGRSVFTYELGEAQIGENSENVVLPSDIESGIYVVNFLVGNKAMSAKVMIQK